MKYYLWIALLCFTTLASAQRFTLQGRLVDTVNAPLSSATVLLLNPNDSSLVNFCATNAEGNFVLKSIAKGNYLLKITYVGFRSYARTISTDETSVIDFGSIKLEPDVSELEAVVVLADRVPVTVKNDTIEFDAASFKTQENAVLEDLLKKLPGVEVDNDGNVKAQGETVKRVTVDGKNFFGSDHKLAIRNLPANAIEKVQVFDKKSDQATFSGIDDGQREKTINLALKAEKRNGFFGSLMGGAGTDERFQGRVSLNRFTKGKQLSFLGMANNINEQGFSMEEYMNFNGASQQMMSGGAMRIQLNEDNRNGVPINFGSRANGIMTNDGGGVNFNNALTKKTEANGSYFYSHLNHNKEQTILRQNFLPGGNFTFNEKNAQANTNTNHRVNFTLDHKVDSANSLKLTASASYNETESNVKSTSSNIASDHAIQNGSTRSALANGATTTFNTSLLWRHKFNKKGRTFSVNLKGSLSNGDREGKLQSENFITVPQDSSWRIRQDNSQSTDFRSYGATISYTEPLGKRKYLEANYGYRVNLNDVNREVYDVNDVESCLNTLLSNKYSSNYQYQRAGLNFRIVRNSFNLTAGSSVQRTSLAGKLNDLDVSINKTFENILPTVRFTYNFSNNWNSRFDYETSVQEPTIQQLQPIVDNSDPLNLYVGNPNLRPAYLQSWRWNLSTFDPASFVNFFSFVDFDYTTNAIVNAQVVDEQLVRTTIPVNVSSSRTINGNANFGFPIQKFGSRFNIGADYQHQKSVTLLNEQQNSIAQETISGTIHYSYHYKEMFNLELSADVDRINTRYAFRQPDQTYVNQTYSVISIVSFLKNYQFASKFEYLKYNNNGTHYSQNVPLLNLSMSRFVLKNKSGEVKLSVVNLFDKALGVNQTASLNYTERQITNSLGRYFMLTFTYALNKQLNPMGMRRGGMMHIRNR
jgi:hypothetical protein